MIKRIKHEIFHKNPLKNPIVFILLFALVSTAALTITSAAKRTATTQVATFTNAASQPTVWGAQVHTLHEYEGKVYAGYGDWNANTGPIWIESYDPATGIVEEEFRFRTEATHAMTTTLSGRLFVPAIDRKGADLAIKENGQWRELSNMRSEHLFAALEFNGKLWAAGQKNNTATIWSSSDDGVSWQIVLQDSSAVRMYFLDIVDGTLYAQPYNWGSVSHVYDPITDTWSEGPNINGGERTLKSEEFNGQLVMRNFQLYNRNGSFESNGSVRIKTIGTDEAPTYTSNLDFDIEDGVIYFLTSTGDIRRGTTVNNLSTVATVSGSNRKGTPAESIEVIGNKIFVGTDNGTLEMYDLGSSDDSQDGGSNKGKGGGKGRNK